jgi:hypothetical protein
MTLGVSNVFTYIWHEYDFNSVVGCTPMLQNGLQIRGVDSLLES